MAVRKVSGRSKIAAYLEIGDTRTFAGAIEWPGWARAGRDEATALANLAAYGQRYRKVVNRSRLGFESPKDAAGFDVQQRLPGDATTDFGAPGAIPSADQRLLAGDELDRLIRILRACWRAFATAVEAAKGVELRKGPRGGGRDLEKMVNHVADAELGYITMLGARAKQPAGAPMRALEAIHEMQIEAVIARVRGELPEQGARGGRRWPARFFMRRTAWHALDHAWEIEDRAAPEAAPALAASPGS